jgi:hypothetical protein
MEFCKQAFSKLTDADLGESIPWSGFDPVHNLPPAGAKVTRYAAATCVTNVLIERYAAFAGYLQLHYSLSQFDSVPLVKTEGN